MNDARLFTIRASEVRSKAAPVCDACQRQMWWHGSTFGWGCPGDRNNPACRSSLYRPKRDPQQRWPYDERYPEAEE